MTRLQRLRILLRQWYRRLKEEASSLLAQTNNGSQESHAPKEQSGLRYDVQDQHGKSVGGSNSLNEASQLWQDLTNQQGSIIDTETGKTVDPSKDDLGRYVVVDSDGQQIGSFDDLSLAEHAWRTHTNQAGRIIDMQSRTDVTPQKDSGLNLDPAQLRAISKAMKLSRGALKHYMAGNSLGVDPKLVRQLVSEVAKLPVPVFDISNIRGNSKAVPTRTIPITRRSVKIETVRRIVEIEETGPPAPSGRLVVPYPTEETDIQRMRTVNDFRRTLPRQWSVPPEILGIRIARRSLLRTTYEEEVPGTPTVRKRKVWREFEEPKVEEWTEEVEITEEPQSQLLEVILDISGSMHGASINLALAMAASVIGRRIDDDSRYYFRQFANLVGNSTYADSPSSKRRLLRKMLDIDSELGGGTNIIRALEAGAADVRSSARSGDQPELLLITDADDHLTAEEVYRQVGEDVILHTVAINPIATNQSLKEHSSTYYELRYDGEQVTGREGDDASELQGYDPW